MRPIKRHKMFEKNFKKRIAPHPKLVQQFEERFEMFTDGERGHPLKDHPLAGKLVGKRAFSVAGDIRVIYEEQPDAVVFLDIGSHNQVY